jgi:hypothetical protein
MVLANLMATVVVQRRYFIALLDTPSQTQLKEGP